MCVPGRRLQLLNKPYGELRDRTLARRAGLENTRQPCCDEHRGEEYPGPWRILGLCKFARPRGREHVTLLCHVHTKPQHVNTVNARAVTAWLNSNAACENFRKSPILSRRTRERRQPRSHHLKFFIKPTLLASETSLGTVSSDEADTAKSDCRRAGRTDTHSGRVTTKGGKHRVRRQLAIAHERGLYNFFEISLIANIDGYGPISP